MARSKPLSPKWTLIIMGSIGLVLVIVGAVWGWSSWSFTLRTKPATGKIEGYEARESTTRRNGVTKKKIVNYPVFSFKGEKGAEHKVTAGAGQSKSTYAIGEAVPVLYSPENPQEARINNFAQMWMGPVAIGVMGCMFLGIGILIYMIAMARTKIA